MTPNVPYVRKVISLVLIGVNVSGVQLRHVVVVQQMIHVRYAWMAMISMMDSVQYVFLLV